MPTMFLATLVALTQIPTDTPVPPTPPIYAVWQVAAADDCEVQGPDRAHRNTIAVLVARDYLVAPMLVFDASEDVSRDPDVCIHDPGSPTPIRGTLVDADMTYRMVLIRAATPVVGAPTRIDLGARSAISYVRFMPAFSGPGPETVSLTPRLLRLAPCHPDYRIGFVGTIGLVEALCVGGMIESFNGAAAFSSPRTLSGLFTDHARHPRDGSIITNVYLGVPPARIRTFVEGYFTSWGRHLSGKPKLP